VGTTVSTYSWRATAAAALVPAGSFLWLWATYDFYNPDGSPDNALIHSLPAIAVFALVSWILALVAFRVLGLVQRRRAKPSLRLGLAFALVLSAALSVVAFWPVSAMPGATMFAGVLFAFSWVSLAIGATTQILCMRRARLPDEIE
jgi:hypothetical protein